MNTVSLMDRRLFLQGAGLAYSALLSGGQAFALSRTDAVYASAFQTPERTFGFALLSESGEVISEHRLSGRGHGFAASVESRWNVAFARAPGNFALAFRSSGKAEPIAFATREGCHFYGHGTFSADGKLLYATENDFEKDAGIIGIYETSGGFRRVGEFTSGGIGPHEMLRSRNGNSLWVANGGILTHPDTGKAKLNLDTMRSSIALIDLANGDIRSRWETPPHLQRLSLRHMALDHRGHLWIGAQHEGPATDQAPLIATCSTDSDLGFVTVDPEKLTALRNYVGAVAASADGTRIGFTSPEGGASLVLDVSGQGQTLQLQPSVCGIAGRGVGFIESTGDGRLDGRTYERFWDNHIARIA